MAWIGGLHPDRERDALRFVEPVLRLQDRWRVLLLEHEPGEAELALLGRARVVVATGPSAHALALRAVRAGAAALTAGRRSPLTTSCHSLAELAERIASLLEDEPLRLAEVERQTALLPGLSLAAQWRSAWHGLEADGGRIAARRNRPAARTWNERGWTVLSTSPAPDPVLVRDLAEAAAADPANAAVHYWLGTLLADAAAREGHLHEAALSTASGHWQRALAEEPDHVLAGFARAQALVLLGEKPEAVVQAQRTLAVVQALAVLPAALAALAALPPWTPALDGLRFEWEAAAWENDPQAENAAKKRLLAGRLHQLLAELTGELHHYYEAAMLRPELPSARAALGCALGRLGQPQAALPHLRDAAERDPLDGAAARALFLACEETGDARGQRRVRRTQRLLHQASPARGVAEAWCAEAAPVGDETASVVVAARGLNGRTMRCLESVRRHSRRPVEIIVVIADDVSDSFGAESAKVEVVRFEQNIDEVAAINLGLARARGAFVVLLRDDAVVAEGWLERLVEASLHDWPRNGLVGPAGGPASGSVDRAAKQARRAQAGRAAVVPRLEDFCMLARRDVLDALGPLDESLPSVAGAIGAWCAKAAGLGLQALVALDVFVHHEPDTAKAEPIAPFGTLAERPRVSLCMIVRNEEQHLPDCLASVAGLVDEIVVVDTGSTDGTREIARRHGARLFDMAWPDSFAEARNESLRHARGEWIFWMDADDRLDEANRARLVGLFAALPSAGAAGFVMKCRCLPDLATGTATDVDHVRLFRNDPRLRWKYRVHEQILMAIREAGGEVDWSEAEVHHVGYQDPQRRGPKLERDLRLLRLEDADHPDDPFTLFNLGWTLFESGLPEEALAPLQRSLDRSQPEDSITRKLHALLLQCQLALGRSREALAACRAGRRDCPDDAELLFEEGWLLLRAGQPGAAEACFTQLVGAAPERCFASVDAGLRGYQARHALGLACRQQGRAAEAKAHWERALAERGDHAPTLGALAELHLDEAGWPELEAACVRLEALNGGALEAETLRARGLLARREFGAARSLVEGTCGRHPRAVWPRVVRSHVLLQEGRDWPAALEEVLALDPGHEPSRHNLELLLREHPQLKAEGSR